MSSEFHDNISEKENSEGTDFKIRKDNYGPWFIIGKTAEGMR